MKTVEFAKEELEVLEKMFDIVGDTEFEDSLAEYNIYCDIYNKIFQ